MHTTLASTKSQQQQVYIFSPFFLLFQHSFFVSWTNSLQNNLGSQRCTTKKWFRIQDWYKGSHPWTKWFRKWRQWDLIHRRLFLYSNKSSTGIHPDFVSFKCFVPSNQQPIDVHFLENVRISNISLQDKQYEQNEKNLYLRIIALNGKQSC